MEESGCEGVECEAKDAVAVAERECYSSSSSSRRGVGRGERIWGG